MLEISRDISQEANTLIEKIYGDRSCVIVYNFIIYGAVVSAKIPQLFQIPHRCDLRILNNCPL